MMTNVIKACFEGGKESRRALGSRGARGEGCPGLTTLGGYLDGTMPAAGRETIEAHLVDCPACRRVVVELYMLLRAKPAPVPEDLEASVRSLVPDVGGAVAMAGLAPGQEAESVRTAAFASRAS